MIYKRLITIIRRLWKESMSGTDFVAYLRKNGIKVGKNVNFRYPAHTTIDLNRPCLIEFGDNLDINDNFTVLTHDFASFVFRRYYHDFVNSSGKVKIGNNIVFGRNVTILKGVTIGDNCIIGAGSIVSKSIPSNSVAMGIPAKVILSLDDYYKRRKNRQITEAIDFAIELARYKGGVEKLKIDDFTEEWVLFLNEDEYNKNKFVRQHVDFRLKGQINIPEFFKRPRPFLNFDAFLETVRQRIIKYDS